MSDNTQDSGSSRRSFRGRIPISASDATSSLKNGLSQLGGSISRGVETIKGKSANLNGRFGRESSVYSKAVRELDNYGYERYNISDESEIFISKVSDRVDFDADGADTMLVRATGGNFVGSAGLQKATFTVPQEEKVEDARSLFGNVITRAPAETEFTATVGVNRDGDIGHVSKPEVNVGRAPIAKFAEETPVVEAPAAEPERKVPDYMSRIRSGSRPVPKAHVEETPAVETVEVPVVEAPVEAPVIEEADEDEPIIMAVPQVEETPVVEAVEEAVVEEVDEIVEAPVEAPVIEEPAELFIIQETPEVEETVEA
ncbi:MAG: hypothetical protein Q4Q58_05235, partial [Thermoplasmata archaeon]|nr:hypothetical protein [Thermoplasmata archaeon]